MANTRIEQLSLLWTDVEDVLWSDGKQLRLVQVQVFGRLPHFGLLMHDASAPSVPNILGRFVAASTIRVVCTHTN